MSIEEFIKQIKKLKDVKINCEIKDNTFFGYIQGIISSMEKKLSKSDLILKELKEIKLDITHLKSDVSDIKTRLTNVENDVSDIKTRLGNLEYEAIKHGWDLDHNK